VVGFPSSPHRGERTHTHSFFCNRAIFPLDLWNATRDVLRTSHLVFLRRCRCTTAILNVPNIRTVLSTQCTFDKLWNDLILLSVVLIDLENCSLTRYHWAT